MTFLFHAAGVGWLSQSYLCLNQVWAFLQLWFGSPLVSNILRAGLGHTLFWGLGVDLCWDPEISLFTIAELLTLRMVGALSPFYSPLQCFQTACFVLQYCPRHLQQGRFLSAFWNAQFFFISCSFQLQAFGSSTAFCLLPALLLTFQGLAVLQKEVLCALREITFNSVLPLPFSILPWTLSEDPCKNNGQVDAHLFWR